jgi:tRNA threonylcarbamoyladenosine biosynthesis protein TsaE
MTNHSRSFTTHTPESTETLAALIGNRLKGGEVIELVSDLGGGKTTFVRGLARGFGSEDKVASPTYTISKVYKDGERELHHFDFYRLQEAGLISHELTEVIDDPQCTVVFEWGEVIQDVLPAERLTITLAKAGETTRNFHISYPEELAYLLESVEL